MGSLAAFDCIETTEVKGRGRGRPLHTIKPLHTINQYGARYTQ